MSNTLPVKIYTVTGNVLSMEMPEDAIKDMVRLIGNGHGVYVFVTPDGTKTALNIMAIEKVVY